MVPYPLCSLAPAFLPPTVHPGVRTAFERHDRRGAGSLEPRQVRRALAELGADVSHRTAHTLVETYGVERCDPEFMNHPSLSSIDLSHFAS